MSDDRTGHPVLSNIAFLHIVRNALVLIEEGGFEVRNVDNRLGLPVLEPWAIRVIVADSLVSLDFHYI